MLVQVTACPLFSAKTLPEQCCLIVNWLFGCKGMNFSEILIKIIKIQKLSFKNMPVNMLPAKWPLFCSGLHCVDRNHLNKYVFWILKTIALTNDNSGHWCTFALLEVGVIWKCMWALKSENFHHTKHLTHTLKDVYFIQIWNFGSLKYLRAFLKVPQVPMC